MDKKPAAPAGTGQAPPSPTKTMQRRHSRTGSTTTKSGSAAPALPAADTGAGGEKLSGAELKKRKQAEKQARRAQLKGPDAPASGPAAAGNASSARAGGSSGGADGSKKGGASLKPPTNSAGQQKNQHKRSPSTTQKVLPTRPAQISSEKTKPAQQKQSKQDAKRVALFSHLYGQPRNTTIIGAGKDIHPAVLALGLQMSSYAVCGSSARCVATLLAFKRVIESYTTPPGNSLPRHLTGHLNAQIEYLVSCRAMATAMGNAIRWLKVKINDVDPETEDSAAKSELCQAIDGFILEKITAASQEIVGTASSKIQDGDVILTFAKSNVVSQTLIAAHEQGRRFRVVVVDSRPLFEGKHAARALAAAGLDVQYTFTHALAHVLRNNGVSKVLLGAAAMLGNGHLYARAGSALVALMAAAHAVPVIVCCESVKFTDRVALDSIVVNEVAPPDELVAGAGILKEWRAQPNLQLLNLMYDVTPAEYITMVVTEYGSLPPTSVPVVHGMSLNT